MGKEYEFQILDVNVNAMKKKLKEMKGKQIHKNIKLVRSVFNRCNSKIMGFARVRYEGKNTTMTVKIYNNVKFPDEYEVTIKEDFETGKKFLEVEVLLPQSQWAPKSVLMASYSYYLQNYYSLAIENLKRYFKQIFTSTLI